MEMKQIRNSSVRYILGVGHCHAHAVYKTEATLAFCSQLWNSENRPSGTGRKCGRGRTRCGEMASVLSCDFISSSVTLTQRKVTHRGRRNDITSRWPKVSSLSK